MKNQPTISSLRSTLLEMQVYFERMALLEIEADVMILRGQRLGTPAHEISGIVQDTRDLQRFELKQLCIEANKFMGELKDYKAFFSFCHAPQDLQVIGANKSIDETPQQEHERIEMEVIRRPYEVSMIISPVENAA